MEPMTIREILQAVDGRMLGEFGDLNREVSRVETDSRTIHAGSLFVPLMGERFDGHAYINAALEGGRLFHPAGAGELPARKVLYQGGIHTEGPAGSGKVL